MDVCLQLVRDDTICFFKHTVLCRDPNGMKKEAPIHHKDFLKDDAHGSKLTGKDTIIGRFDACQHSLSISDPG